MDEESMANLVNVTISGNSCANLGGGFLTKSNASPTFTNCIVALNEQFELHELGIYCPLSDDYRNVVINLADIQDENYRKKTQATARQIVERAARKCAEVLNILDGA